MPCAAWHLAIIGIVQHMTRHQDQAVYGLQQRVGMLLSNTALKSQGSLTLSSSMCTAYQRLTQTCTSSQHFCTADGLQEHGSSIQYKANVRRILTEGQGETARAVGVQLQDGRTYRAKVSYHAYINGLGLP